MKYGPHPLPNLTCHHEEHIQHDQREGLTNVNGANLNALFDLGLFRRVTNFVFEDRAITQGIHECRAASPRGA